ncbi:rhomboid family intramembrane serine protease [Undibacterium sp. Ji42W]|uniref:rhomboid family intramembrane serine protease n=1 Tax=Undibacterium sp. Ji42W TaxID=3413039 RepID=UPI003BF19A4E
MDQKKIFCRSPVAILLFVLILAGWIGSALYFEQSFFASQKSLRLPQVGAVTGELFVTHEWWRLLVSQFLHVHFLHMLFNASSLFIIASSLERTRGWLVLLAIYLIGGTTGQIASVWYYPELVSDGASQALMALCAGTLVLQARSKVIWFAGLVVALQVALDVHAIAGIKAGHLYGFAAGLLVSLLFVQRHKHQLARETTSS